MLSPGRWVHHKYSTINGNDKTNTNIQQFIFILVLYMRTRAGHFRLQHCMNFQCNSLLHCTVNNLKIHAVSESKVDFSKPVSEVDVERAVALKRTHEIRTNCIVINLKLGHNLTIYASPLPTPGSLSSPLPLFTTTICRRYAAPVPAACYRRACLWTALSPTLRRPCATSYRRHTRCILP